MPNQYRPLSPDDYSQEKLFSYSFWIIVFLALALRLWGIWNVTHPDEYNEVFEALRVCSGHFNFERWVKRFYLYVLAFEYCIYYAIGLIFQLFSSPLDFAEKIVRNMEPLFILGRITSALAGTCTVGLLYVIGHKFFNRRIAIISSLFLTLTVLHIDLSQQAKVDATLGLLAVASFYFIFKILSKEPSTKWDYAWCGLFMALAVQTKINAIVITVPFFVAFQADYEGKFRSSIHKIKYFVLFFTLGFIIGNPPILFAPHKFIASILTLQKVYTTPINVTPAENIGFIGYPLRYFRDLGIIISLFTLFALVFALLRLNRKRVAIISFIVPFYLIIGSSKYLVHGYYLIPIIPFLYLLIADFIDHLYLAHIKSDQKWHYTSAFPLALLIALSLIQPIINVSAHEIALIGKNTRYLAKDWIETHIPSGSKILMDSGKAANTFAPPISENRATLRRTFSQATQNITKAQIVHGMVDEHALIYYRLLEQTVPEISYDITSTMFGLRLESLEYYINNNYIYFIISDYIKTRRTSDYFTKRNHAISAFYDSLDTNTKLRCIKTIKPMKTNKGDTIYIYKVKDTAAQIDSTNDPIIGFSDHTRISNYSTITNKNK